MDMTPLEPLYDKNFECLFCKKPFFSKRLRSKFIKVTRLDTDFSPIYQSEGLNPLLYHIQVCPVCGFSFSDDFSAYFPPGTRETIEDKVCSRWVPHNFSEKRSIQQAIETYKLAIYCGTLKKEKHIILAGMYMRIAWLYRSLKNDEQEQRFMKLAVKEYEDSYFNDDYRGTTISEVKLFYLIGELSRRMNDRQKAVQYFSRVIEKQKLSNEPNIIEMAKDRWHEIRESKKGTDN